MENLNRAFDLEQISKEIWDFYGNVEAEEEYIEIPSISFEELEKEYPWLFIKE